MPTMKELLEGLDIDLSDINDDGGDGGDKEVDPLKDFDIEKVPEELRPAFKALSDNNETLMNEVAGSKLMINTLKDLKKETPEPEDKGASESEKKTAFGVSEDDPYFGAFNALGEALQSVVGDKEADAEKNFTANVAAFAKENKDIVRYAGDMDSLVAEHPTLKNDIPKLYKLAKSIAEGREGKVNTKKEEVKDLSSLFRNESAGLPTGDVEPPSNVTSLADAMELALKTGSN